MLADTPENNKDRQKTNKWYIEWIIEQAKPEFSLEAQMASSNDPTLNLYAKI